MNLFFWKKKPQEEDPLEKRKKEILKAIKKVEGRVNQVRGFWIQRQHVFSKAQLRQDGELHSAYEEVRQLLNAMKERLEEGEMEEYHQIRGAVVEMEHKMLQLIEKIDQRSPTLREKWANWLEE